MCTQTPLQKNTHIFVAFSWEVTSTGQGGFLVCVCSIDSGSGELGIEPATPGLQGITLITTSWHNYNGLFTLWLFDT